MESSSIQYISSVRELRELINTFAAQLSNELWKLSPEPKCRHQGWAIQLFEDSLINLIERELLATGVVEYKENENAEV